MNLLKLMTLPLWLPFYVVGKLFRVRAIMRSGRRVQPVRVVRTPALAQRTPIVVRVRLTVVPPPDAP